MQHHLQVEHFKFHYIVGGNKAAFRAKKGTLGENALTLGEDTVPYEHIVDTTTRGNRLFLVLSDHFQAEGKLAKQLIEGRAMVLEPKYPSARVLEMAIDRKCADVEAAQHRVELEAKGLQHLLRTEECPVCSATVDLSGLDPTPYIYCRFCETIFTADRSHVTTGERYRTCDECGMFDRIQQYPEFYFYFLLIVYGFRYKQRFLCDSCAHRLFLKALGLNALFVIGVPTAIWVKIKSMTGRDPNFATMAKGNSLARAGRYQEAAIQFDVVLRSQPEHPAVLLNQALGHLLGGDKNGAVPLLERSLAACNHYIPVLRVLRQLG